MKYKFTSLLLLFLVTGCKTIYTQPTTGDISTLRFKTESFPGHPFICVDGKRHYASGSKRIFPEGSGLKIFGEYPFLDVSIPSNEIVNAGFGMRARGTYGSRIGVLTCSKVISFLPKIGYDYEFVVVPGVIPESKALFCDIDVFSIYEGRRTRVEETEPDVDSICKPK